MARTQAEITRAQERHVSTGRLAGEVASDLGSVSELVRVRVPNPDGPAQMYGPMRWFGSVDPLPESGDWCLIVQAANTREWVAFVWPLAFDQPE